MNGATEKQVKTVIGIDVGGSTTKICGFRSDGEARSLIAPLFVRATDPLTSIYGAFGRFTAENHLSLADLDRHGRRVFLSFRADLYIGLPQCAGI